MRSHLRGHSRSECRSRDIAGNPDLIGDIASGLNLDGASTGGNRNAVDLRDCIETLPDHHRARIREAISKVDKPTLSEHAQKVTLRTHDHQLSAHSSSIG